MAFLLGLSAGVKKREKREGICIEGLIFEFLKVLF